MVECVTGVPGAGKSYYAMVRMAKSFSKDDALRKKIPNEFKIKDVDKAYTNVNELKLDELNNVKYLDMDDLIEKLTKVHYHYKKDKWTDKQLNELCTELEINNAMFLIDEAHNYFDQPNTVLIWWISYHRHFNQHIILLTQNLSLVNTKYKAFPEIFLKAIPATLKVFNNTNVYKKYTQARLSKTSQAGSLKIKKYQEVYELYGSGANHNSKSVVLPYLIGAIVLILSIILYFKFLYSNDVVPEEPKKEQSSTIQKNLTVQPNNIVTTQQNSMSELSNKKLITVYCNKLECYYRDFVIPIDLIHNNKDYGIKILTDNANTLQKLTKYRLFIPNDVYSIFDIERKNYILGVKDDSGIKNSNYYSITK
jgi:zona occludens toxin